jgi:hypothetical protein
MGVSLTSFPSFQTIRAAGSMDCLDPRREFLRVEGLGEVVVRSHGQGGHLHIADGGGGEHEDAGVGIFSHLAEDFDTVHGGGVLIAGIEVDIQNDEIGVVFRDRGQGVAAIGGRGDGVAFVFEDLAGLVKRVGFVFHHQDSFVLHRSVALIPCFPD